MEYKRFSVAICVYKNDVADHFKDAVDSILNQTIKPSEIIIVVDGPVTVEIESVLANYNKNNLIKILRLKENMGHGIARRTAIENCKYDYVALMDADDISVKNRFELQLSKFYYDESLSIVGGNIEEFEYCKKNIIGVRKVPSSDEDIKKYLRKRCPFNQVTVMIKKNDVIKAGNYLDWFNNEDYYLWIRMFQQGFKFANIDRTLVYVRIDNNFYQRRGGLKYFISEYKLQKYMYNNKIICLFRFIINISIRFILQVLIPNSIRAIIFKKLARKKPNL